MASPAQAELPNGISTPPTTASGAPNPSPPTASSAQPNPQSQALSNGHPAAPIQPSHPATSLQDSGHSKRPRDARLMHMCLAKMGVHAYTERVPLQLMDFAYRYTQGILSDAIAYEPPTQTASTSKKANKDDEGVSMNALRTAVAARAAQQFNAVLPKEFMTDIATERNRQALPKVEREFGVRLPPERYCFTGVGWGMKEAWEDEVEEEVEMEGGAVRLDLGGPIAGDTVMGGMEEEDVDEDQFEEVMGVKGDADMADG
ncbi:TFIID-31kDa-domain-containing protein [Lophiostoma macrostomum CBS 122681]|uniref:TFIID-31kDa-domain-containing protein n=1 Tax=Lophiostoma macrostomum CBS 122681 TaxID=1314788 RepID=A0A6A6TRL8_9PLEO|nr:TFIID-31kDa-domain-containing protein [Lophiostoma macrostomum CBS 122681]